MVEPTKSSSKANRQLVKRNSPSSSGGTDLRISSPNTSTRNGTGQEEFAVVFWWNRPSNPRVSMNLPVKPIDSWSRGIRRRLLVEPTFESPQPNRQLVKRNSPSSSGGTDLRISSPNSWSRGIRRRLLVEPTFESLHPTLSLEMEVIPTIMKQEIPRNPTFLHGLTQNGSNPINYETRDSSKPNFPSYILTKPSKKVAGYDRDHFI
ncbi:unnamed protein product [Protopolystoma xenopodis]|uniref:Uncharacterized protein n=1 Tax=Protopolystoma xenopodis TaxID=117903 RepID=A0A448XMY5_9PLAT|nr:unnamed protein product [Protopolystoma xenopodis]